MTTRTRSFLMTSLLCLCGAAAGYVGGSVLGFFFYIGSYNAGHVIRLQAFGIALGGYFGLAETGSSDVRRMRKRFVGATLALLVILCTEGYFFGIGTHRIALHKIYNAGGNIARNAKGEVISVALGGRPYHGFEGDDFRFLQAFPKLHSLGLYWPEVGDPESEIIGNLTNLKSLALFGESVDDRVLANLRGLRALEVLDLSNTKITDDGVHVIGNFRGLQKLNLDDTAITDDGMMTLNLSNLTHLDLSFTAVGDSTASHINSFGKFEDLRLGKTEVTHNGIQSLSGQTELRTIGLAYANVGGPGFESIKNWTHLESLNLNETNVSDEDLKAVLSLDALEDIQLSNTQVTDAGVLPLGRLKKLKYLLLNKTRVSPEAVDRLREELPNCNVVKNL